MLNNLGLGFVFTARDLASGAIQNLERNFMSLDRRVGLGTERIQTSFQQLGLGLAVFAAGAAVVGGAFALANAAGKFEQAIAAVGAVSGATAQELEQLRDAAIGAGIAAQYSPTEATLGLRELAQAGLTAQESRPPDIGGAATSHSRCFWLRPENRRAGPCGPIPVRFSSQREFAAGFLGNREGRRGPNRVRSGHLTLGASVIGPDWGQAPESDLLALLRPHCARSDDEGRTLLHELFRAEADIDVTGTTLRVTLHTLSSPHRTQSDPALCDALTETGTPFPGSRLTLRFAIRPRPQIGLAFPGPRTKSASPPAPPPPGP